MRFRKGIILLPILAAVAFLILVVSGYYYWQSHIAKTAPIETENGNNSLAIVRDSGSTNFSGYQLTINQNGSGYLDSGRKYPAGYFNIQKLTQLLSQIGDVRQIKIGWCSKSASFGSTTTITYKGQTSVDLQCIAEPSPKEYQELAAEVQKISDQAFQPTESEQTISASSSGAVKCGENSYCPSGYECSTQRVCPQGACQAMVEVCKELNQNSETANPDLIGANWKTYTNSKYHLSFNYPAEFSLGLDNEMAASIVAKDQRYFWFTFDSPQMGTSETAKITSFLDYATHRAIENSAANGPNTQAQFDKVLKQTPLKNPNGLTGYEFYFHWAETGYNPITKTVVNETTSGPILFYDVSVQTNNALRGIEILGAYDHQLSASDAATLEKIGNSLRFN